MKLLDSLAADGIHIAVEHGRMRYVVVGGAAALDTLRNRRHEILEALLERARERRDGDLARSVRSWPADLREAWEERAAIMEFDAGMSRSEAEMLAEIAMRQQRAEAGHA